MYISRVEIDRNNRQKTKDLTHLGAYHSWVEDSFERSENRSRKLWRIDTLENKEYLLVVSKEKPDARKLEKYGVPNTAEIKNYSKFLDSLEEEKTYIFRAKLNPCKSLMQNGASSGQRGRLVPCLSAEDQLNYLLDRAEKNGFYIDSENGVRIVEKGRETFKKKGQRDIKLVKTVYEGLLTITDLEKFKDILINGLGRKKAYGFGLFTVAPYEK